MILGYHQGHVFGHAVLSPDIENVLHQRWFLVQSLPGDGARFERIMFERYEGQIGKTVVGFEIVHKAAHPGSSALRVGPDRDVFIYTLENRSSELQLGINLVNGRGPLDVERAVVFWESVLSVGFFTHLDSGNGVAAFFDIGDLRGGIVGCAVEHGDGNHRGKVVGESAGEENVEAAVLAASAVR